MTTKLTKTLCGALAGLTGLCYSAANAIDLKYYFKGGISAFSSQTMDNIGINCAARGIEPEFSINASTSNVFASIDDRLNLYGVDMQYQTAPLGKVDGSRNSLTMLVGARDNSQKFSGAVGIVREDNNVVVRPEGFDSIVHSELFYGPVASLAYNLNKGSSSINAGISYSPLTVETQDRILDIYNKTSGKGSYMKGILGAKSHGVGLNLELEKKNYDLNGITDIVSSRIELTNDFSKNIQGKLHYGQTETTNSSNKSKNNQIGIGIVYTLEK